MPTIESSHRQLLNEYSKQNFTVIGRILEDIQVKLIKKYFSLIF